MCPDEAAWRAPAIGGVNVQEPPYNALGDGSAGGGQGILNALSAVNVRGAIVIPPGIYDMPAGFAWPNYPIDVFGFGTQVTILRWATDLGAGAYAIPASTAPVAFHDIGLQGPGAQSQAIGVVPANMSGLRLGSSAVAERVRATGFRAGAAIFGDHQILREFDARYNYYGAYWEATPPSVGDQLLDACRIDNNNFASLAVSPVGGQQINDASIRRTHLGWGPYGIYGESGAGSFLSDTLFENVYFEMIGNGMIFSAGNNKDVNGCTFRGIDGYWNAGEKYAANAADWVMAGIGQLENTIIDYAPGFQNPGAVGILSLQQARHVQWNEANGLITNLVSSGKPLLSALESDNFLIRAGAARYLVAYCNTAVLQGDVVQAGGLNAFGPAVAKYVAAAIGAQAPIVGVAAVASPVGAFQTYSPICIGGQTPVRNVVATVANQYLLPDPANNGAVVSQAAAPGAGAQLVGIGLNAGAANSTTNALIQPHV